jgi:hypothetical protein
MNRDRFQDLLDIRGSDLAAWPDADRIAAERLIASDQGAAKIIEDARCLEGLIRGSLASAPQRDRDAIASRILSGLPKSLPAQERPPEARPVQAPAIRKAPKPWTLFPAQSALLPRFAALGFAAAFGIAVGLFWAQQNMADRQDVAAASEDANDVTAVIFQTDSATGLF